ncbi:hypothetical protein [Kitasatospora sp. NPDC096204]|uniref:hypothetical protein n=1 Tax=Kitasatospora sp. NPDC096204 TaxID=3364094 RepID=UPI00381DEB40
MSRKDEDDRPREFVFVEVYLGRAVLRPLGYSGPEHRVDLEFVEPIVPVEIAAGTAGHPHRHRADWTPA